MLLALLALLLVAVGFVLRELVSLRRQISSIRQSLEWFGVGFLEKSKDGLAPAVREYVENAKQDLIREGLREGTLTEQLAIANRRAHVKHRLAEKSAAL